MNTNKLDELLSLAKNESFDSKSIDYKTQCLIKNIGRNNIPTKHVLITAMGLLVVISAFGSYNMYDNYQNQLALQQQEQMRKEMMNYDYIYNTMLATYTGSTEE